MEALEQQPTVSLEPTEVRTLLTPRQCGDISGEELELTEIPL